MFIFIKQVFFLVNCLIEIMLKMFCTHFLDTALLMFIILIIFIVYGQFTILLQKCNLEMSVKFTKLPSIRT